MEIYYQLNCKWFALDMFKMAFPVSTIWWSEEAIESFTARCVTSIFLRWPTSKHMPTSIAVSCSKNTLKVCLTYCIVLSEYNETCLERPLPWETTCLEGPQSPVRRSHISLQLNLSPKITCFERPYLYGQWEQSFKTDSNVIYRLKCDSDKKKNQ